MRVRSTATAAAAVRGRRLELGLSQDELARRAGVSRKWVYEFEAGKPAAQLGHVLRVCEALGLETEAKLDVDRRLRRAIERGELHLHYQPLVATGGRPRPFPGVPFDGKKVISYFEAMVPKELPKKLVIIGGGVIGLAGTQVVVPRRAGTLAVALDQLVDSRHGEF